MRLLGLVRWVAGADIVPYWQREKSTYRLWELLLYMGQHTVPQTAEHFHLPPTCGRLTFVPNF